MYSRIARILVVLLLSIGLFAQTGILRARRPFQATKGSAPASEDANPIDDANPEEEADNRGEESTRGESALGLRSSPFVRRGLPLALKIPAHPPMRTTRLDRRVGAGPFLAAGRALRYWIQSQRC